MKLYPHKPIQSIESLARSLGIQKNFLLKINQSELDKYYRRLPEEKRKLYYIKNPLKLIQKRIKNNILDCVEYPNFLHGGIAKRSAITCAKVHLDKAVLSHEDIEKFFPSVTEKHIFNLWRYHFHSSEEVAKTLTRLTTYKNELPQGSSTSVHLANLVLLAGNDELKLYQELKISGYDYTRYIDDIQASSKKNRTPKEKTIIIRKIIRFARSKGFRLNPQKREIQGSQDRKSALGCDIGKHLKKPNKYTYELIKNYKEDNISKRSREGKLRHIEHVNPKQGKGIRKTIEFSSPKP